MLTRYIKKQWIIDRIYIISLSKQMITQVSLIRKNWNDENLNVAVSEHCTRKLE